MYLKYRNEYMSSLLSGTNRKDECASSQKFSTCCDCVGSFDNILFRAAGISRSCICRFDDGSCRLSEYCASELETDGRDKLSVVPCSRFRLSLLEINFK